jgi:hypothetical protein
MTVRETLQAAETSGENGTALSVPQRYAMSEGFKVCM